MIISTIKKFFVFIRRFIQPKQPKPQQIIDFDIMAPFEKPPQYHYDWIQDKHKI